MITSQRLGRTLFSSSLHSTSLTAPTAMIGRSWYTTAKSTKKEEPKKRVKKSVLKGSIMMDNYNVKEPFYDLDYKNINRKKPLFKVTTLIPKREGDESLEYSPPAQRDDEEPMRIVPKKTSVRTSADMGLALRREQKLLPSGSAKGKGGRKNASAVSFLRHGDGKLTINGMSLPEYFKNPHARDAVLMPLVLTETLLEVDVELFVHGGGEMGQSHACRHAVAVSLQNFDPYYRRVLKSVGLLTRDPRVVERKHAGKKKARKSAQWVKR